MSERRHDGRSDGGRGLRSSSALLVASASFLSAVYAFSPIPVHQLSLDPNHVGGLPWYVGIVSMLGAVAWSISLAAAAGGAWIAGIVGRHGAASMLRGGALLSALLLVDDLFQLHILPAPVLGIPKTIVLGLYGLLAGWWLVSQWNEIARTRQSMLLLAAFFFGLSLLVDQAGSIVGAHSPLSPVAIEDGAKFLGTAMWAQYFVQTAGDIVRSIVASPRTVTAPLAETPRSEPNGPVAGLVNLFDGRVGPVRVPSGGQY